MKNHEEAVKEIESIRLGEANWTTYLKIHSSFFGYSSTNRLLLFAQNPEASMVARFGYWKKMGRYVKKGETALKIFAPIIKKDENGKEDCKGFFLVSVFDVSQTEGTPLPDVVQDIEKTTEDIIGGIENLTQAPIVYESNSTLKNGTLDDSGFIVIPDTGTLEDKLQNIVKGYSEYLVKSDELYKIYPKNETFISTLVAESVNFIISKHFGFKKINYSLPIEHLQDEKFLKDIDTTIAKYAGSIIKMVDDGNCNTNAAKSA